MNHLTQSENKPLRIRLQLQQATNAQRETTATFIRGTNAQDWLKELSQLSQSLSTLQLVVIPKSCTEQKPLGVFVLGLSKGPLTPNPNVLPLGCEGQRLYLPITAKLTPPVTPQDWQQLLGIHYAAYFWHPSAGLIGIEQSDFFGVGDLLNIPTITSDDWSHAKLGLALNQRLHSLRVASPPSVDDVIKAGQDDIGTDSHHLKKLFDGPKPSPLKGLGSALMLPFKWLANKLKGNAAVKPSQPQPRYSNQPSSLGNAINTAANVALFPFALVAHGMGKMISGMDGSGALNSFAEVMKNMSTSILSARNREMNRLMDMLDKDPDKGLRHAIPFGSLSMPRGFSMPGWKLFERNIDISAGSLGGSGLADIWDIPYDMQIKLEQRYRELAQREMNLGRYRRAAHIFAKLLGDLHAAAGALKAGRMFREAAIIYKDKLKKPRDAAECLEAGGLIEEAIPVFEELKEHEHVGDLYTKLQREDEANAAYQNAIETHLKRNQPLTAATIQEEKLHDIDAALKTLHIHWPQSLQAQECLKKEVALLGKLGRHEAAQTRLFKVSDNKLTSSQRRKFINVLDTVVASYPDQSVQEEAKDLTHITASQALLEHHSFAPTILKSLTKLAPTDQLLERDCRRFGGQQEAVIQKEKPHRKPKKNQRIKHVLTQSLGANYYWSQAAGNATGIYAVGVNDNNFQCLRTTWNLDQRHSQRVTWNRKSTVPLDMFLHLEIRREDDWLLIAFPNGEPFARRGMSANDIFPRSVLSTAPIRVDNIRGFTADEFSHYCFLESQTPMLHVCNEQSVPVTSLDLTQYASPEMVHAPARIPMTANQHGLFIGLSRTLIRCELKDSPTKITAEREFNFEEDDAIHSLSVDPQRFRVAVGSKSGVKVAWDSLDRNYHLGATSGHSHCQSKFLPDGNLIVADGGNLWLYYMPNTGGPYLTHHMHLNHRYVMNIIAGPDNLIGLLLDDGDFGVYQLPT